MLNIVHKEFRGVITLCYLSNNVIKCFSKRAPVLSELETLFMHVYNHYKPCFDTIINHIEYPEWFPGLE